MSEPSKEVVHVTPMPIAETEGEMIRRMEGKLPSVTLQMDYGYPRNTHLRLEVEVRVQSFLTGEIRSGPDKGQTVRTHNFAVEQVKIIGAYTADQMEEGVGGSASAAAVMKEEEDERERDGAAGVRGEGGARPRGGGGCEQGPGSDPGGGGPEAWEPDF